MRTVRIAGGVAVPCPGQGTGNMGERPDRRAGEIAALRTGVELGITLIETAQMYGDGATEDLVGEAIEGIRDDVFLVSKAYPQNASRDRMERACEASLSRNFRPLRDQNTGRILLRSCSSSRQCCQRQGTVRHCS